jgi:uncharacterized membrane protein
VRALTSWLLLTLLVVTPAAHAYIGPGASAGTIAVVFGVIASVFLAFVAIVWYPIKRLFKGRKTVAQESGEPQPDVE